MDLLVSRARCTEFIFAASIILGVTALGAVVARFAGARAKFYKSALTVYQEITCTLQCLWWL